MRWDIEGADRTTGEDMNIFVEAATEPEARKIAQGRNIAVSAVTPMPETRRESPKESFQEQQKPHYDNRVVRVVCPKCKQDSPYPEKSFASPGFVCVRCNQHFQVMAAKMRANRSRGNRRLNRRDFSIRVYVGQHERLIEFVSFGWADFELRSGDDIIISSVDGRIALIQNLTIGKYYVVRKSSSFVALVVLVVIVLVIIIRVMFALRR